MATMEDAVSRESIESSSTGDEFVVVNGEPKLKFTGDFNDICDAMMSDGNAGDSRLSTSPISQSDSKDLSHVIPSSQSVGFLSEDFASPDNIGDTGDEQAGPGQKLCWWSSGEKIMISVALSSTSSEMVKTVASLPLMQNCLGGGSAYM